MLVSYLFSLVTIELAGVAALPSDHSPRNAASQIQTFNNVTIFTPPADWTSHSTSYARTVLLNQNCEKSNVLLATFTYGPPDGPYMPVYRSTDLGRSWSPLSKIHFSAANGPKGGIWQPFLYELPERFGKYPAGTVLATGNAIPSDFSSTNIQLYASMDQGKTFEFVSNVATGTGPNTTNGAHPIWEPFIMAHDGQLGVFYSDQRDPKHGQKLAHQTSTDLLHWGPVVNDAAETNYTLRPGMTTIAKMGNGKFIFSYEMAFAPEDPVKAPYASHYRIADSPFEFANAQEYLLKATDGTISSAGPYTIWTPAGGPKGTVVTSDSTYDELFINTEYGAPNAWVKVPSGHGVGYTRALQIMPNSQEKVILLTNGGMYGENSTHVSTGDWVVPGPGSNKDTISNCGGHV